MPGRYPQVDDELLFRVITGSATETEREALALWLQSSAANVERFREIAVVLEGLRRDEANLVAPAAPAVSTILARARLAGGRKAQSRRRPVIGLVTVGLTAAILLLGLFLKVRPTGPQIASQFGGEHVFAQPAQPVAVTLHDGTQVELAPGSSITTQLRGEAREVFLDGRASFVVARQGARTFVVRTSAGEIRDIGTHFTVRVKGGSTQVAVFEGRVGFSNPQGSAEAAAGEMIATSAGSRPVVSRLAVGHSPSDWVRAALVFERTPVEEIAAVIAEHYGVPVHIADRSVGQRTVSAWFVQEPSLDEVFTAVCRAVDARCSVAGSTRVISQ